MKLLVISVEFVLDFFRNIVGDASRPAAAHFVILVLKNCEIYHIKIFRTFLCDIISPESIRKDVT